MEVDLTIDSENEVNSTAGTPSPGGRTPSSSPSSPQMPFPAGHSHTPPPNVNLPPLHPSSLGNRKSRRSSWVWDHFEIKGDGNNLDSRAICKYCRSGYAANSKRYGTSNLINHINNQCKKYPGRLDDKRQKTLSFDRQDGGGSNLVAVSFNKEAARRACARMIMIDELPFRHVEGLGFRQFYKELCPRFDPPSRTTIVRDICKIYQAEKGSLKKKLARQRVSLTTDCWTSIQNMNYMCLTAHFIDSNWELQKRIINFCIVPDHKGETIGNVIEQCLIGWGLDKVFTVTLDNATSNDKLVEYLQEKFIDWGPTSSILDGKYLHMRCCAHILNLIVKCGLQHMHDSVAAIRNAIRYVKSSPARLKKFNECVTNTKIESKVAVFLDLPTRWNATYLMLEAALKYQKAFRRMELDDSHFRDYFKEAENGVKKAGPPKVADWKNAEVFINFLKSFYDVTVKFSASLQVTSTSFLREVCGIYAELSDAELSEDETISQMARKKMTKYNKYWGNMAKVNQKLLLATVLDPRCKMDVVEFLLGEIYDETVTTSLIKDLTTTLEKCYKWYEEFDDSEPKAQSSMSVSNASVVSLSSQTTTNVLSRGSEAIMEKYKKKKAQQESVENIKNDVERYLSDPCESMEDTEFDVLRWWRLHGSRTYCILSKFARDLLAIQVSTVASESAFSTGGRILDPFCSSLAPKTVELLICLQNWLNSSPTPDTFSIDDVEYYNVVDEELSQGTLDKETGQSTESSNEMQLD